MSDRTGRRPDDVSPVYIIDFNDGTSIWGRQDLIDKYFQDNPNHKNEVSKVTEMRVKWIDLH